jgi:hypothetical protein
VRVQIDSETGCWNWLGATKNNYAVIRFMGRNMRVHRLIYLIFFGVIPEGQVVCHRCDNPICIRPTHLFAATQLVNIADMITKERHARGEKNGSAKLTEDDVRAIRKSKQPLAVLCELYGLKKPTLCKIRLRRLWKHVK